MAQEMSGIMKSRFSFFVSAALAALAVDAGNLVSAAERPPGGEVRCKWPANSDETGQTTLKRYGKQARVAVVAGVDGESGPRLQLYPDDPTLRLEIGWFGDVIRSKPTELHLREKDSKWSVFGLKVGMTLEEAAAVNGGPLDLWGFQQMWDGGPNAVLGEFRPGKLEGGCKVIVVFSAPDGSVAITGPLYGLDHIASDDPRLLKIKPTISDLLVSWELPQ
jgi:hypothetical protein